MVTSPGAARCHHPGGAETYPAPTVVGKATLRQSAGSPKLVWQIDHASTAERLATEHTQCKEPKKLAVKAIEDFKDVRRVVLCVQIAPAKP